MNQLKRMIVWMMRCHHCCGFGVQSPHDYRFIRNVINEHLPYYAYAYLRRTLPSMSSLQRKKAELIFRLANWQQTTSAFVTTAPDIYIPYLKACRSSLTVVDVMMGGEKQADLSVISFDTLDQSAMQSLLDHAHTGAMLVVDHIHEGHNQEQWKKLLDHPNSTLAFDLYYLGIILVQPSRYTERYIVNF